MKWVVVDESGDVGRTAAGATKHMLVAAVVTNDLAHLRRVVKRTRQRLDRRLKDIPEFKAFKTDPRITRRLLADLAATDCEIILLVADKRVWPPDDEPEALYRALCARVARLCMERYEQVVLIVDKRGTGQRAVSKLSEAIGQAVAGVPGSLLFEPPRDSCSEQALQVADAVAWAAFQQYEHGDPTF